MIRDDDQVDFAAFAAHNSAKRAGAPQLARWAIRPWQWIAAVAIPFVAAGLVLIVSGPPPFLRATADTGASPVVWQPSPQRIPPGMQAVLSRQAEALLASDRDGWLAPVDVADRQLRQRYEWLYINLRNLDVDRFKPTVDMETASGTVDVKIDVCLASATCPDGATPPGWAPRTHWRVTFHTSETDTVISNLEIASKRPAPWELAELTFRTGPRTTVAATPAVAELLPEAHREAEAAAAHTDAYATRWPRPRHYIVYLAGAQQFEKEYFGGQSDSEVAGYATPGASSAPHYEVVLRTPFRMALAVLMRHELGHAATLTGADHLAGEWITEGVAEHIAYGGKTNASPRMNAVRRYIASGWTGDLTEPATKGKGRLTYNVRYGLGHLAVGCLIEQYGLDTFLAFFDAHARRRGLIDDASVAAFGTPWSQVNQRCAAEIRRRLD